MPNTYEQISTKKFVDAAGLTHFAQRLNNYPTNDVIAAVIDGVQDALDEKMDTASYNNETMGQGYGVCDTAATTTAKEVELIGYELVSGGIVSIKFTYAVPASATLNIDMQGAKDIYYRGAAIAAGVIDAGDIATFMYYGNKYHLLVVDRVNTPATISNAQIDALFASA